MRQFRRRGLPLLPPPTNRQAVARPLRHASRVSQLPTRADDQLLCWPGLASLKRLEEELPPARKLVDRCVDLAGQGWVPIGKG